MNSKNYLVQCSFISPSGFTGKADPGDCHGVNEILVIAENRDNALKIGKGFFYKYMEKLFINEGVGEYYKDAIADVWVEEEITTEKYEIEDDVCIVKEDNYPEFETARAIFRD